MSHLRFGLRQNIIKKRLKFYVIDAYNVARETGMAGRINTVMQTCFFAISGVLPGKEVKLLSPGSRKRPLPRDTQASRRRHMIDITTTYMVFRSALPSSRPLRPCAIRSKTSGALKRVESAPSSCLLFSKSNSNSKTMPSNLIFHAARKGLRTARK